MEFESGLSQFSPAVAISEATLPAARDDAAMPALPEGVRRLPAFGILLAAVTAAGALGIAPSLLSLWDVWANDPLRSIGMLIVPAAIVLLLRAWQQCGWELRGRWWGLVAIVLAYAMSNSSRMVSWNLVAGPMHFNLFAPKLALYGFASGVVLLFAGKRVWLHAWFPLALLLCAQPVPAIGARLLDLPLQSLSAHIARSFAWAIGFPPSDHELLRLMFTPEFGMFIAPGCDGLRGAVTLGYAALIAGYLKRVSIPRWLGYVTGAVLLGYLFNLIRLCALVLYYRIAVGHHSLEHAAATADYVIGGCLILVATLLFLRLAAEKPEPTTNIHPQAEQADRLESAGRHPVGGKLATFAAIALLFAMPGVLALRSYRKSFAATVQSGGISAAQLNAFMPEELGGYRLSRAWQEQANGRIAVESAAYSVAGQNEATLGIWLPPSAHSMHESWRARGEDPLFRAERSFVTARGPVSFDSAFYSDGVTDSFAGNALCTPAGCLTTHRQETLRLEFTVRPIDYTTRGVRAVSIFFSVEMPHTAAPPAAVEQQLTAEAARFLAGVDFADLSRKFQ